ncbi:MAG: tRNA lysidine(34) synthetase TilS [Victivallaceae bacterium]|nr:tRNA lysidine(34) synthetase TilS [Victivallaceae bacterium]MDD5663034.1 tRNA lysidine(34) synthetase TilS [Victivallaceae bacterium]
MKLNITFENPVIHVGFSGGADSTALLLLLVQHGYKVIAVHFEHGIRGRDSIEDAAWCRSFCLSRNLDYMEIPLQVMERKSAGENLEAAARRLRLEEWRKIAGEKQISVALGHHADDRIENLLIRLGRGSNASGLSSMRSVQHLGNIIFFRPLLKTRRNELENYLRKNNILDWRNDNTNDDETMHRNYLRNKLLPEWTTQFAPVRKGLLHAAEALEIDADYLENEAATHFSAISGKAVTPVEFWRNLHPAIRGRALRLWLSEKDKTDFIPGRNLLVRFNSELESQSSETRLLKTGNNLILVFSRNEIWLREAELSNFQPIMWDWRQESEMNGFKIELSSAIDMNGVTFDAELLPDILEIKVPAAGDTMIPFGAKSPKKLKKIISDAKLSAYQKNELLALAIPCGEIIWIPGLRRSAFAPVTEITKQNAIITYHN